MSQTNIYLGISLLDFTGPLNVKRQINDYRDTDIGSAAKSYTIDIPLTPANALILKHINDIRSREEVSDEARIVIDGSEVLRGKFRVLSLNSQVAKSIVEADDWIDDVKGISIRDLSWVGGDDHTFTAANVENSWGAGAGAFYRYPLINFAALYSEDFEADADMYPYDFYSMWSIEDIVTKIFAESGYTVAGGSFFSGTFGRALYIFSAPIPRDEDFITNKGLLVYVDDNTDNRDSALVAGSASDSVAVNTVLVIEGEVTDEGADFSTGTYRYTAAEDGTYRFQAQVKFQCSANVTPGDWLVTAQSITWSIRKNTTPLESFTDTETNPPEPTLFAGGNVYNLDTGWIFLEASDFIDVHINVSCTATNTTGGELTLDLFALQAVGNCFLQATWDERNLWPGIGQTISPTVFLPDIDTLAFLKGLKDAFNLRFWMDRPNRTIYIETADDFLGSTVVDYTNKIDYSEELSREVVASKYNKTQRFKWIPDNEDKAYSNYVNEFGTPFEKVLTLTSEYLMPGTNIRQNSIFSPTVLGYMNQIAHFSSLVPRIFGSEDFVATKNYPAYRPKAWLTRIFEWKGLVNLTTGSFDYFEDIEDGTPTNYTTFPSVVTPDMSDMYDDYWLKDFRRIDKNKLAIVVLNLTPREIIPFSTVVGTAANEGFRATYKLNIEGIDMYFYMTRITTDGDRVKCEFMQKL